jgi:uncharacterized protein
MTAVPSALPRQATAEVDLHPPKHETHDLAAMINTDPKGFRRAVDTYRVEPFGLYLAREIVGHPKLAYVESWLLPEFGLVASDWYFRPGHERDQDFYLDISEVRPGQREWHTRDLYLDVVLRTGRGLEVLDTDELLAATGAGFLDASTATHALETTYHAVERLTAHGYDLGRWLAAEGVELSWQRK